MTTFSNDNLLGITHGSSGLVVGPFGRVLLGVEEALPDPADCGLATAVLGGEVLHPRLGISMHQGVDDLLLDGVGDLRPVQDGRTSLPHNL